MNLSWIRLVLCRLGKFLLQKLECKFSWLRFCHNQIKLELELQTSTKDLLPIKRNKKDCKILLSHPKWKNRAQLSLGSTQLLKVSFLLLKHFYNKIQIKILQLLKRTSGFRTSVRSTANKIAQQRQSKRKEMPKLGVLSSLIIVLIKIEHHWKQEVQTLNVKPSYRPSFNLQNTWLNKSSSKTKY